MLMQETLRPVATSDARSSVERLRAGIRAMAPEITARALEIEAARRIPLDLVEKLRSIGAFRLVTPRARGGLELDLPTALDVISQLARIEGAIGWTVMIGSGGHLMAPMLPQETYDQFYRRGPDVVFAGSIQPVGTMKPVPGGYLVSGRWPFASGCQHADWMLGVCVAPEDGQPGQTGSNKPRLRAFTLPAAEWQIEDTWYAAGLKGTGSHHIAVTDQFVPEQNFCDFPDGAPCMNGPLYQVAQALLPMLHGALCVGIAEAALDDVIAIAAGGRQQLRAPSPMRDSERFQGELGRIAADVRAARAFLDTQAASHWRQALAGTLKDEATMLEGTQAAIWLATTCTRVADACFSLAGASALYDKSPLQRRMRDVHTAAQHVVAHPQHYPTIGKMLLAAG